jgi:AcrR family transcriptional regulator
VGERRQEKARRGPYAKSAARRDAILDAALTVFATNGYWNGSLEDIAREVGVTKPALRYYFHSKSELYSAVLERRDAMALVVSPLDQEDPVDALRGLVRLVEHNVSIPGVIAVHTKTSAEAITEGHPAHEQYIGRYAFITGRLTKILQSCAERGVLAQHVEPPRAARLIVAMMDGLQIQWLTDRDSVDLVDDFSRNIGDLLTPEAHWESTTDKL